MPLRIIFYQGVGGGGPEVELLALRDCGKAGAKDEGKLRAVLANCWALQGFKCTQLDFKPIEGQPYFKKLWEARYLKTARNDGVHGYRLFYLLTRAPKVPEEQVVVVLMIWAKQGDSTPQEVLVEAWKRYLEVEALLLKGKFF